MCGGSRVVLSSVRTFGRGRPSSSAVSVDSPLRSLGAGFASWAILLLPILDGYVSFLPGISAGLAFFLLGVVVLALTGFKWSGPYLPLMPVILYLLASPLLMLAFPIDSVHVYQPLSVALRWGKLLICLVPIFVFGGLGAMQLDSLLRRMRKIVYVAAVFIVVQRVAYAAGIVVPNPFVAFVSSDSYSLENYTMGAGALFRPSAFFLEPSHLTYYVIPFVICALFGAGKGGFPLCLRDGIVGAAAILCSGSGMGLLAVFSLFFLYSFMRSRKQVLFLGGVLLVAFALLLILNTSFFQGVVNRFLDPNAVGGNAIEARLGDGFLYFENKGFLAQLFGSGGDRGILVSWECDHGHVLQRACFRPVLFGRFRFACFDRVRGILVSCERSDVPEADRHCFCRVPSWRAGVHGTVSTFVFLHRRMCDRTTRR